MKYILAIDQGTTSSRAFIIRDDLGVVAISGQEFKQYYPKPGWVEHEPEEIWGSVCNVVHDVLKSSDIDPKQIAGIGITNQRETTVMWSRKSGESVHPAIVWQDRRTGALCEELKKDEPLFMQRTGLVLDPYFSGTKMAWMLENVKGLRKRASTGEVACGTVDAYLLWKLTGGAKHMTDVSNASRTLLMNLESLDWDDELIDKLGVTKEILPTIVPSSKVIGETKGLGFLPDGIPIAGMIGDQQGALFGQLCFDYGDAKCTYGTGSFILMNTGNKPLLSNNRLLTTVGWKIGDSDITYAIEGSVFIAGAAVQWLRDGLGLIKDASEIEALAGKVSSSEGVVFVPALVGLGAPHWCPDARGVISGITRGTTAAHLARATLEGIAFQQCDLVRAMHEDAGVEIKELRVDGGASANDLLMQIQADLLGCLIVRPREIETTVMGAAFLAGLATGVWDSKEAIRDHWAKDRDFKPSITDAERKKRLTEWSTAVNLRG